MSLALSSCLLLGSVPAYAADSTVESNQAVDPNLVISTKEELTIPNNVTVYSVTALNNASITYDHNSGIDWDKGNRQVWGNIQAQQGNLQLDSYTRARFEHTWVQGGSVYGDSGRVWSTKQGRSYARSDWENYNSLNSGVAKTYYGI
ncbi:hypothetical protein [Paenibacillus maysiensis]|uniref:hypothetical protein n=1 Tax=Paenibacillus maysiensis TaxID=1155954 RepID=UPI00047013C5|nr:hypothetical protein [Paenibacillus maysiensis]